MREEVLDLFSIFLTKSAISPSKAITDTTSTNYSMTDEGIKTLYQEHSEDLARGLF